MPTFQQDHQVSAPAALSDEQFAELKELLRPGYELSKLMLADYMERATAPPSPPVEREHDIRHDETFHKNDHDADR